MRIKVHAGLTIYLANPASRGRRLPKTTLWGGGGGGSLGAAHLCSSVGSVVFSMGWAKLARVLFSHLATPKLDQASRA